MDCSPGPARSLGASVDRDLSLVVCGSTGEVHVGLVAEVVGFSSQTFDSASGFAVARKSTVSSVALRGSETVDIRMDFAGSDSLPEAEDACTAQGTVAFDSDHTEVVADRPVEDHVARMVGDSKGNLVAARLPALDQREEVEEETP